MAVPYSRYVVGSLPWYGFLIVLGAAFAIWLAGREEKVAGLPKDTFVDLALRVLPIGILGARLYYVAFSWDAYREDPLSILYIWNGGLAIYGGLIAGFLTILFFCRKRKLPLSRVCDALIPGVAFAQALGRWGNYFNQEAYGLPFRASSPFCFFPLAILIEENGIPVWHMATFFYESVMDFCIFLFLLWGRRKMFSKPGDVFCFYLYLYGAGRLIVENFRMDALYAGNQTVRVSQLLSVMVCAAVFFFQIYRLQKERVWSGEPTPEGDREAHAGHGSAHMPPWMLFSCCLGAILLILLMIYCLCPNLPILNRPAAQLFFLAGSVLALTALLLANYFRYSSGGVFYANHKDEESAVPGGAALDGPGPGKGREADHHGT